jgi:hypothetical protein
MMAAKSKNAAAANGPVRKPAKKSTPRLEKGKGVVLEVVSDVPDLMPPEVLKQILQVQDFVGNSEHMTNAELATGISAFSKQASDFSLHALKAGASALVYAWACGKLLNTAKRISARFPAACVPRRSIFRSGSAARPAAPAELFRVPPR